MFLFLFAFLCLFHSFSLHHLSHSPFSFSPSILGPVLSPANTHTHTHIYFLLFLSSSYLYSHVPLSSLLYLADILFRILVSSVMCMWAAVVASAPDLIVKELALGAKGNNKGVLLLGRLADEEPSVLGPTITFP